MDIILVFTISAIILVYSIINSISIGYVLTICWFLFVVVSVKRGYNLKHVLRISMNSVRHASVVLQVFVLIGIVIGVWMSSGTVASIVYYCLKIMDPKTIILSAFIISSATSFLIGTSMGTVSIVGIPIMIICNTGGVNPNVAAGALIAGAYVGDRCSFMSSSAMLVSSVTNTDIFNNIRNMMYSSVIPFVLSIIFYYVMSMSNTLETINNELSDNLIKEFNTEIILLIPGLVIIVLSLIKVKIKRSMTISIICACFIAVIFQERSVSELLSHMIFGFECSDSSPLFGVVHGGGVLSMVKPAVVVSVSCALTGIFNELKVFDGLKEFIQKYDFSRGNLFGTTTLVGIVAASVGCNQSIAIIMTQEIMEKSYNTYGKEQLALDIENSAVLLAGIIPWSVASLVPTTTLGVGTVAYIPYAFYIYIFPIVHYFIKRNTEGEN